MKTVAIDPVEPADVGSIAEKRSLGDAIGTTDVAINHYRLAPGDRLAGLHAHADQEEIFVVLDGTLTVETLEGVITVTAGEAVRFEPGEHQSGKNDADRDAVVLALGAPRDTTELLIPVACPECGHDEQRLVRNETGGALVCDECGAESRPRCPECGGQDLQAVLGDDGETPVSKCKTCGTEWK
ncbi:Cupin domain-containing protein [Halomicrobium zhouii]|uniref:Cupin domain-containing protein n=1 Tax=Halomicrobium zhouii TaxID=767519 RepID=A0A1I6LPY5_9EURY|nr:cupin domain-containing protein [Halomicrobium zhouii]SFS05322.1 Cupin domain-containing protein [Halomicrobium zhouii]